MRSENRAILTKNHIEELPVYYVVHAQEEKEKERKCFKFPLTSFSQVRTNQRKIWKSIRRNEEKVKVIKCEKMIKRWGGRGGTEDKL